MGQGHAQRPLRSGLIYCGQSRGAGSEDPAPHQCQVLPRYALRRSDADRSDTRAGTIRAGTCAGARNTRRGSAGTRFCARSGDAGSRPAGSCARPGARNARGGATGTCACTGTGNTCRRAARPCVSARSRRRRRWCHRGGGGARGRRGGHRRLCCRRLCRASVVGTAGGESAGKHGARDGGRKRETTDDLNDGHVRLDSVSAAAVRTLPRGNDPDVLPAFRAD